MKRMLSVLLNGIVLLTTGILLNGCGDKSAKINGVAKAADGSYTVTISEPQHSLGYLPIYIAQNEGYLKDAKIKLSYLTGGGGAHVKSVISGDSWAVIGSIDSNEAAAVGSGVEFTSIVNCAAKANVYITAATVLPDYKGSLELSPDNTELIEYFLQLYNGKPVTITAGRYGGTPNVLVRYMLVKLGFKEVSPTEYSYSGNGMSGTLYMVNTADASAIKATVETGGAQMANPADPMLAAGVLDGTWYEPFIKFHNLGDFAYSVLSTTWGALKTEEGKAIAQNIVSAIVKSLKKCELARQEYLAGAKGENYEWLLKCAKDEFGASYSEKDLVTCVDRALEDAWWSPDGSISKQALDIDMEVMAVTGIYTGAYTYEKCVDMEFVNNAM
ncbi:MAG: hypothetical protein II684_06000 [Treponema sp.]|nr:hypothetical protein [Treponema sp.]